MDMQNVAKLEIPEGEVRTIHDKDGDLLWGKVAYSVRYKGDTAQNGTPTPSAPIPVQTVTGENVVKISDGENEQSYTIDLGGTIELDMSQATRLDAYINGSGVIVSSEANALFSIAVEPNTTYTITKIASSRFRYVCTSTTPAIGANVGTTTNNDSATSITVTTGASDTYLVCTYWSTTSTPTKDDVFNSVKITTGVSIELCKIGTYQDYIWNDNGTWKKHKVINKAVLNGSEDSWQIEQSGMAGYFYRCNLSQGTSVSENIYALYSNYGVAGNIRLTTKNEGIAIFNNNHLRIRYGAETSLNNWKAKLAAINMTLYYPITPTDETITNQALVTQLEAVDQWTTRYGYNASVTGNLPIIIDKTQL